MSVVLQIFENKDNKNIKEYFNNSWKEINKIFKEYGCILLRGFNIETPEQFYKNIQIVHKKLKNYTEASTPRKKVGTKVYTSTEYPSHKSIPLHNEMSYSKKYPKNLWFFCAKPSETGGETTVANSRNVLSRIDKEIVNEFKSKKIKYIRRYGFGIDLSCEDVFGTNDKNIIEQQCKKKNIEYEWQDNHKLITKEVNQVTITHPIHDFEVWFNQAHLFHHTNLNVKDRNIIEKVLGKGIFSRDVVFGDDTNIPYEMFDNIRKAYNKEEKTILWQHNDLALLDNLHIAHGRKSFTGTRKVFVAMTDD